jgi:hypothetical protein
MSTVRCIITYPEPLISNIGDFEINSEDAKKTIEEPGRLKVVRENVNVSARLHVLGLLFGPENAICYMDVFVGDEKVNPDPVESVFNENIGVQVFNWSAS